MENVKTSASELMAVAEEHRRRNEFGEAINAFCAAAAAPDATDHDKVRARVSIELIREINGFVNVDLMNP